VSTSALIVKTPWYDGVERLPAQTGILEGTLNLL
jgi:hypothetical protein